MSDKKRILILGGGFGGVYAAEEMCHLFCKTKGIDVTLVNKTNYFLFTPLLHEVATGSLSRRSILLPVREMLRETNFKFVKGTVESVDLDSKKATINVRGDMEELEYDYVIFSLGSTTNFMGIDGAEKNSFTLKSVDDADKLRNHILEIFEIADLEKDEKKRKDMLRFIVVGGGPTGVETVAEIHDLVHENISKLYKRNMKDVEISLVHSSDRLLNGFSDELNEVSKKRLKKLGVKLRLKSKVTKVESNYIEVNGKEKIETNTMLWTAGVKPNEVDTMPKVAKDDRSRIVVNKSLQIENYPDAFAIGDNSSVDGEWYPSTAQVALQQAKWTAKNIFSMESGSEAIPFKYNHRGNLMSLGPRYAAAHVGRHVFHGPITWFLWRTIYLSKMMGARNKAKIASDWFLELIFRRDTSQV